MSVSSQGSRKASLSPTSPTIKVHQASASTESQPGITRTNLKVSFKDRIRNIQKDEKAVGSVESLEAKQQLLPSTSAFKPKKPSTTKQLKEKIKSFGHLQKDDLTPWSKLKRATVVGLGGSYTSLSNNLTEDSPKLSKTSIKSSMPVNLNIVMNKLDEPAHVLRPLPPARPRPVNDEQKTSCSDSDTKKFKPRPFKLKESEPKSYRSVDDLSPEYSGLPFVKKLKILNERQKLAELESAIQTTRSLSLDYTDSSNSSDVIEVLTRSQSEASCMIRGASLVPVAPLNFMSLIPMNAKHPLSPESNETIERKNLKSILRKKLSEDRLSQNVTSAKQGDRQDMKRLMRAQTLEGYVARRTKFTKSVTFNHTLSSPPSTTLTEEPEESLKDSPNDISPQYPPVFSPSAPPQSSALYPIANAQEEPANQVIETTCTNRYNYSTDVTIEESPKIINPTSQPQQPSLPQPPLNNNVSHSDIHSSGTLAFVSDNYGERKLIKGIPFHKQFQLFCCCAISIQKLSISSSCNILDYHFVSSRVCWCCMKKFACTANSLFLTSH